jgi:hypothetical protein
VCPRHAEIARATRDGLWICGQRKGVAHRPTGPTTTTTSFNLMFERRLNGPKGSKPTWLQGRPTNPLHQLYADTDNHSHEYAKPRAARFSAFSAEDTALLAKAAASLHVRLVEVTNPDLTEVAPKLPAGRLHASGKGLVPYIKGPLYLDLIAAYLPDPDPPASPDPTPQEIPGSWDEIEPGHVVIAKETSECGWWDAVVIERNGDLVTVRYRDYPQYPPMVRHRSAIALISPAAK